MLSLRVGGELAQPHAPNRAHGHDFVEIGGARVHDHGRTLRGGADSRPC